MISSTLLSCIFLSTETEGFIGSSNCIHYKPGRLAVCDAIGGGGVQYRPRYSSLDNRALFTSNSNGNDPNNNSSPPPPPPPPPSDNDEGRIQTIRTTSIPYASYFLLAVTVRSFTQLITLPTELPGAFFTTTAAAGAFSWNQIDWIGTLFDVIFVVFGIQTLLRQNGLVGGGGGDSSTDQTNPATNGPTNTLSGLECRITLDVGREPGTMMEADTYDSPIGPFGSIFRVYLLLCF